MAPWCFDECPVCKRHTKQWIGGPEDGPNGEGCMWFVCEVCQTVLVIGLEGLVSQRAANERERAVCRRLPRPSTGPGRR